MLPAVALANVAKKQRRYDLMMQANVHYGKALRQLAKNLLDPELAKHDSTLLCVEWLGHYEVSLIIYPADSTLYAFKTN